MAMREEQVDAAVRFLANEKVSQSSSSEMEAFLSKKGLSNAEIAEAFRRNAQGGGSVSSRTPAISMHAMAGYSQAGAGIPYPPAPAAPWQAYSPPWPAPAPRQAAPWWALLLSGLGLGSALALLGSLLAILRRRMRQALTPPQASTPLGAGSSNQAAISNGSDAGESTAGKSAETRLAELSEHMRAHVEETREATASLRRSLEQQQRLYQMAAADFQRKLEEASKRKTASSCQRVEISSESMQLLKSLVSTCAKERSSSSSSPPVAATNGRATNGEALKQWFSQVDDALQGLLRSASSQLEAKRSLQTVSMIIHNLVTNPAQEKFREVSATSARFKDTFSASGQDSSAAQLLKLAGFELRDDVFKFAERSLEEAERVRDFLQDALRNCDQRWQKATEKTADGNEGIPTFSSAMAPEASSSTSSGACLNGTAGGPDRHEPERETAKVAPTPWFSSVVQKQLSRTGGTSAGNEDDSRNGTLSSSSAALTAGASGMEAAAHPAESRSRQEPQSGG